MKVDLDHAQGALTDFLRRNARAESPELRAEQLRLERVVATQQHLYELLAETYERSKIDEVRDTPVFTVVEQPSRPFRPATKGWLWHAAAGGALLAVLVALLGLARHVVPFIRQALAVEG